MKHFFRDIRLQVILLLCLTCHNGVWAEAEQMSCAIWLQTFLNAMDSTSSFTQTGQQDSLDEVRQTLDKWAIWALENGDCMDRYTSEFNYHFKRATIQSLTTSTQRPPYANENIYTLTDSTGATSGYMYWGVLLSDTAEYEAGLHWLDSALTQHPERIDIWQGKIMAQLYTCELTKMIETCDQLLAYSKTHQGPWLNELDEPETFEDIIAYTIQDRLNTIAQNGYIDEAEQLIDRALYHYPESAVYANSKAVLYLSKDDLQSCLEWMNKAHKLAPKDKLISNNLRYLKKLIKAERKGRNEK